MKPVVDQEVVDTLVEVPLAGRIFGHVDSKTHSLIVETLQWLLG